MLLIIIMIRWQNSESICAENGIRVWGFSPAVGNYSPESRLCHGW